MKMTNPKHRRRIRYVVVGLGHIAQVALLPALVKGGAVQRIDEMTGALLRFPEEGRLAEFTSSFGAAEERATAMTVPALGMPQMDFAVIPGETWINPWNDSVELILIDDTSANFR
jgi:predicted dehydrogenase